MPKLALAQKPSKQITNEDFNSNQPSKDSQPDKKDNLTTSDNESVKTGDSGLPTHYGQSRTVALLNGGQVDTGEIYFDKNKHNSLRNVSALNSPKGICLDKAGNLYIADAGNNRIRKVNTKTGNMQTVAGNGVDGFSDDNRPAISTQLNQPWGITVDSLGNFYIADFRNHRVRFVKATTGKIITIAGNGEAGFSGDGNLATKASLNGPFGLALDSEDNLYIADSDNHCIRRVDAKTNVITTVVGMGKAGFSGDGGAATKARLNAPVDVIFDTSGNLIVVDRDNNRIRKVDSSGVISTIAGNGIGRFRGDGLAAIKASLHRPYAVTIDKEGNLFIADLGNNRVRKIEVKTGIINTIAGNNDYGLTDTTSQNTTIFGSIGNVEISVVSPGDGKAAMKSGLLSPAGLAIDKSNLYISEYGKHRIRKIDLQTSVVTTLVGVGVPGFSGDN